MKKICILLFVTCFIFYFNAITFADDLDSTTSGSEDLMQYSNLFENGFEGQKKITDEEFQKTVKQIKEKQAKRKKQNKPMKGQNFHQENSGQDIDETAEKNILLVVPLELINGDGTTIPMGHYKIVGERQDNEVYLDFYQGGTEVAKVPAIETKSDFNETGINFVKLLPYNDERVKIIFGSLDFNAYTFIKIKNKISDIN